jgi:type II secretory pathway pseudopilin PulG
MSNLPPQIDAQLNAPKKKTNVLVWILGGLCLASILCVGLVGAILFPVFAQAKEAASIRLCEENIRKVGVCITRYADQNGQFPAQTSDASGYAGDLAGDIKCPKMQLLKFGLGYAYNAAVYAGKRPQDIPQETYDTQPLLIEIFDARRDDTLDPDKKFGERHMNGRYVTAYYYKRGAAKIKLTDAQMSSQILTVLKDLKPIPLQDSFSTHPD